MSVLQLFNVLKPFFKTTYSISNLYNTILVYKKIRRGTIVDIKKSNAKLFEEILIKYKINYHINLNYRSRNILFFISSKKISKSDIENIESANNLEIGKFLGYPVPYDINNRVKRRGVSIVFTDNNNKQFTLFAYFIPLKDFNIENINKSLILVNKIKEFVVKYKLFNGSVKLSIDDKILVN